MNISYMAMPMLKYHQPMPRRTVRSEQIINLVEESTGVPVWKMQDKTRKRKPVEARQIAMYLLCKFTDLALSEIGMLFGGRDHTSVIHSRETVKALMFSDEIYRRKVDELIYKLT